MHDTLRRRILRKLDTLPETQLYQVLDYIEFLQSRYATQDAPDPSGLQRWAERLEDGLRKRTVKPGNLREAFQLISAADRVLNSVSEAGRQFLDELQIPEEEDGGSRSGSVRDSSPASSASSSASPSSAASSSPPPSTPGPATAPASPAEGGAGRHGPSPGDSRARSVADARAREEGNRPANGRGDGEVDGLDEGEKPAQG